MSSVLSDISTDELAAVVFGPKRDRELEHSGIYGTDRDAHHPTITGPVAARTRCSDDDLVARSREAFTTDDLDTAFAAMMTREFNDGSIFTATREFGGDGDEDGGVLVPTLCGCSTT